MYMPRLFIYSSVYGHLCCFYLSTIVNNATMNIGVQISLCDPAFNHFGYIPRSGIAGSIVVLFLIFGGTTILFSTAIAPFYSPTNSVQWFSEVLCGLSPPA